MTHFSLKRTVFPLPPLPFKSSLMPTSLQVTKGQQPLVLLKASSCPLAHAESSLSPLAVQSWLLQPQPLISPSSPGTIFDIFDEGFLCQRALLHTSYSLRAQLFHLRWRCSGRWPGLGSGLPSRSSPPRAQGITAALAAPRAHSTVLFCARASSRNCGIPR